MSKTPIYKRWEYMVYENTNPQGKYYNGSEVCDRWKDFTSFYQDMGETYKSGLRLKLIDPSLPYSKANCVWSDR